MIDMDAMLKKVKVRLGISPEMTEHDEVLRLMLEDAVIMIRIFCNREESQSLIWMDLATMYRKCCQN